MSNLNPLKYCYHGQHSRPRATFRTLPGGERKREVCAECPWTTVCEGFQVFQTEKPDMRVERARPVVAVA